MKTKALLQECGGKIKAIALTGIRSEYDLLYPLLSRLHRDRRFDLGVVACGAHLTDLHDFSVRQIEADGFRIADKIHNLLRSDSRKAKAQSAANLLQGLSQTLDREKPDLLLVLGDREESVIGALAGTYLGIPVVHLGGGDNTHPQGGNVDEEVRHATTKLSHIHLTMAPQHAERVCRMGEEAWRVFAVGSGGIDRLREERVPSLSELEKSLGPEVRKPYLVLIHHPLSSNLSAAGKEMALALSACSKSGYETFVGSPNSDPGSAAIEAAIRKFSSRRGIHPYKNLPRAAFSALLRNAKCLVGNSSLGLHEAPYLGLPAVNVGERQKGRLAGNNIQWVPAKESAVLAAIRKAVQNPRYRKSIRAGSCPYGDGRMAERSVEILSKLPCKEKLIAKKITY